MASDNFIDPIKQYQKLYASRIHFTTADFDRFISLCADLIKEDKVVVRFVMNKNKELLVSALLLNHQGRLYNIISNTTAKGKLLEANYFLYDEIIKEFAGECNELDLEGSDVKGVADFYKKMGPVNRPYVHIHSNRLPLLIRMFKK
jgi:hypothetical protein